MILSKQLGKIQQLIIYINMSLTCFIFDHNEASRCARRYQESLWYFFINLLHFESIRHIFFLIHFYSHYSLDN